MSKLEELKDLFKKNGNNEAIKNCEDIEKVLYIAFSESKNKIEELIKYANEQFVSKSNQKIIDVLSQESVKRTKIIKVRRVDISPNDFKYFGTNVDFETEISKETTVVLINLMRCNEYIFQLINSSGIINTNILSSDRSLIYRVNSELNKEIKYSDLKKYLDDNKINPCIEYLRGFTNKNKHEKTVNVIPETKLDMTVQFQGINEGVRTGTFDDIKLRETYSIEEFIDNVNGTVVNYPKKEILPLISEIFDQLDSLYNAIVCELIKLLS